MLTTKSQVVVEVINNDRKTYNVLQRTAKNRRNNNNNNKIEYDDDEMWWCGYVMMKYNNKYKRIK